MLKIAKISVIIINLIVEMSLWVVVVFQATACLCLKLNSSCVTAAQHHLPHELGYARSPVLKIVFGAPQCKQDVKNTA